MANLNINGGYQSPLVVGKSAVPISLVEPAATFTAAAPSSAAAGADTLLTSAGVHGLTSTVSVGASIYVSEGVGWAVGFHTITAIAVDTTGTTIQIDTPYDVGMGTPTIALANTAVDIAIVTIPPLLPDSQVRWDVTLTVSPDASAGSEDVNIRYGNQLMQGIALSGTTKTMRYIGGFANKGVTSQQTNFFVAGTSSVVGTSANAVNQYTIDSSIAQPLTFLVIPSMANSVVSLNRYLVEVLR
jgi:hypothetical protein